jgi:hypothetical protein
VDTLLAAPPKQWPELLEQPSLPPAAPLAARDGAARRTPGEQLMADAWAMRRLAARLQVRLLERSLTSLGESACAVVAVELTELRSTIGALTQTLETRLSETGARDGPA